MARRLILDTGVIAAMECGRPSPMSWLVGDDDVSIAAVTVAELSVGWRLPSASPAHAGPRRGRRDRSTSYVCSPKGSGLANW